MVDKWHEIWNKRNLVFQSEIVLNDLLALDGFDSGAGKINLSDWKDYTRKIVQKLNIQRGNTLFEVGCGSGALLFALKECLDITVGGNDYSTGLIKTAKLVFPDSDIRCLEARDIELNPKYDFVVSNSVFQYFELEYARAVLLKMIAKANKAVCMLDIPDIKTKILSEKFRQEVLPLDEYKVKYEGLNHTYYNKYWFEEVASSVGLKLEFFDGFVPNYSQNEFRFGCLICK